ncbi:uncharacterized protein C8orf58 homolog isoform X1 [Lepus europaeus]|uniref:uncharacterized protein C8orf58 homolog isoform X1 n=1 Tax=Lepus europaeus TaxID=9983 RepID=UPI002B45E734|nr:uncharacterized protein C8orf58 homolog isoform X1 [Lepus europaeus]
MRGRRRVYGVEPLGGRDGAAEGLARGCVVPGVASTYRRIAEAAPARSSGSWKGDGDLRTLRRQVPLLKLASRDSGVEMAVGDSPLATLPGSAQDFLDLEPAGSAEPPARRGRTLASQKLEQALERSRRLPPPPANLAGQRDSPQPPGKPECGVYLFGATEHECTGAETDPEAGLEGEVVARLEPGTWACLPGQGLRYLEHLCLVLEQLARLQQLYLQLWSQRLPGVSGSQDPEGEEPALATAPLSSDSLGSGVQGPWELLHQTEQAEGVEAALPPKVWVPTANPPRLPEAPVEPANSPSSQGHKRDVSHWDKVKVLLNRLRWRNPRHPEPLAPPGGSGSRTGSRDLPEGPQYHPHRNTYMPSSVVKKQRAKNLSVC